VHYTLAYVKGPWVLTQKREEKTAADVKNGGSIATE
jgi:hypothetical protein